MSPQYVLSALEERDILDIVTAFTAIGWNKPKRISINDLAILDGKLPPKVLGLVMEWVSIHKKELIEDWKLAEELAELKPIAPLE